MMKPNRPKSLHSNTARRARCHRAFTLIEVVIALAIVAVTIPAFLRVIQGAVTAGRAVEFAGREQLAFEGSLNYIEAFFARIPSEAGFVFQADDDGTRLIVQNVYSSAGEPLRLRDGWNTQLDVRPAANGTNTLVALTLPQNLNTNREEPPPPLPLMSDLSKVTWRFYVVDIGAWSDALPAGNRPALVELKIVLADGLELPRMVFWVRPQTAALFNSE